MGFLTALAIGSFAVTAVSAVENRNARKDAARAQAAAAAESRRSADIARVNQARQALNERRKAQARVMAQAALAGTVGSSGPEGAMASANSQAGYAVGTVSQQSESAEIQGMFLQQAGEAQGRAEQWGAIGGLASTIFSAAGGYDTIFNKPVPSPGVRKGQ